MPRAGLDAAAQSLRAWLNRQQFSDLSAHEVTCFFTDSATRWAYNLGYNVRHEVQLQAPDQRAGRLDLRLRHRSGTGRAISIEIDMGDKVWSLEKLTHVAERGDLALWIRWSRRPVRVPIPSSVRLIRAHVISRTVINGPDKYSLQTSNCG